MSDVKPNIYQRMNAVRKAVPYVMKDSKVTGGGVRRDRVVGLLHEHLNAQDIYVYTTQEQGNYLPCEEKSSKGTPKTVYSGRYTTYFANPDAGFNPETNLPKEYVAVTMEAQGDDFGDKGPGKSRTYAEKMNLISAFLLETGTDEEDRLPGEGGETDGEQTTAAPKAGIKEPQETAAPPAPSAKTAIRDALAASISAAKAGESKGSASAGMVKQITAAVEAKKMTKVVASALKVAELTPETYPKEVGAVLWAWIGEQPDAVAAE